VTASIAVILCAAAIPARCKKGQNVLPKTTKIIAGGMILYGANGKVSNGEVMGRVQVPNLRRSER
jgi:hypothetical protein